MEPAGAYPVPVHSARKPRWVAAPPAGRLPTRRARDDGDRPERRPGIRALDGVRAVAVALVLADHGGIPGMAGGFLGVDVFFVLSGFLITSLLLDELGRSGRIDLANFWIRRARRLLPALVLMVLTVAVGRQFFSPEAIVGLRDDAVAAFFWVANWMFVADKTGYFAQGAPPSPLQHAWSLGVEEQYYIVWPLVLVAVAVVLAARARRQDKRATLGGVRLTVFLLATLGALGSAAAAILLASDATRDRVYFGTDTRAQALLVGAAASALLVGDWESLNRGWSLIRSRWGRWVARVLPVVGLVLLGVAVHYATGSAREFRSGLLIVVAVAAVLVIAPVALDQRGPVATVLAWGPLAWLGGISYGIYLWHWPIFLVLNGQRTGWHGLSLFAVRCAATLAVSVVSWWAIEQPVRKWRPVQVPLLPLAGSDRGNRRGGDAAGGSGRAQARRQRTRRQPSSRCVAGRGRVAVASSGSPARTGRREARPAAAVHRFGVRRLDRLDDDALPAADPRVPIHRPHRDRLQPGARRPVQLPRPDPGPEKRMRIVAGPVDIADRRRPARCRPAGDRPLGDREPGQ